MSTYELNEVQDFPTEFLGRKESAQILSDFLQRNIKYAVIANASVNASSINTYAKKHSIPVRCMQSGDRIAIVNVQLDPGALAFFPAAYKQNRSSKN